MIPRTYPTTYVTANGKQQMVVFFLSSVSGLQRFKDYIPVSFPQYGDQKDNSYDNNGVVLVDVLSSSSGLMAWKDYIPVFVESNAADAWQVSINGYIPVGLATAPSLALDFTSSSQTLDPRITFSRTSNATVTDSSGTLRFAPHNLLTFSEQFDNAAWVSGGAGTIDANITTAPNGTITADRLTTTGGTGSRYQSATVVTGLTYVFSVYVRLGTMADVAYKIAIYNNTAANWIAENIVPSQTVSSSAWTRITYEFVIPAGCSSIRVYPFRNSVAITSSTVFLWGAQLNLSNMVGGVTGDLSTYYPTTVKNLLGFSEAFDNAAWTKSNSFIQTNLLTWSEQFDNAVWNKTSGTVTANAGVAPDGTTTADQIASTGAGVFRSSITVIQGLLHTASVYAKAVSGGGNFIFGFDSGPSSGRTTFNLQNGTIVSNDANVASSSIINMGNGWYRCVVSAVTTSTSCILVYYNATSGANWLVWGAQLVQGSTPGDYQQTFSAAMPVMYRAPNGTMTADRLTATSSNATIAQAFTATAIPYTASIYLKRVSGTGTISISVDGTTFADVTLTTSWQRFNTGLTPTAGSRSVTIRIATSGDVIDIWGAQLSDSASLDTYVNNPGAAPSSTAYYGPRFDYNPTTLAPRGLLIEEQRTNSIRNNTMQGAVAGTPGTLPTNWFAFTSLTGLTREVVGTGTENGVTYVDIRLSGTPSASGDYQVYPESVTTIVAASGQAWNFSSYYKLQSGSLAGVSDFQLSIQERDTAGNYLTGTFTTQTAPSSTTIRRDITRTLANASTTRVSPGYRIVLTGVAIDFTLRIGMPQLEQGAFATSVIPTTTASATRNADVASMTGSNFTSWYRADEGTLYCEVQASANANTVYASISNGTVNQNSVYFDNDSGSIRNVVFSGNAAQAAIGLSSVGTAGSFVKLAAGYKVNDFAAVRNAGTVGTDTSGNVPLNVSQFDIGRNPNAIATTYVSGAIRKLAYYPKRLTNAEIQSITA